MNRLVVGATAVHGEDTTVTKVCVPEKRQTGIIAYFILRSTYENASSTHSRNLAAQSAERLANMAQNNRYARDNWSKCSVLVIDEISMMSAQLFDKLNIVGQR